MLIDSLHDLTLIISVVKTNHLASSKIKLFDIVPATSYQFIAMNDFTKLKIFRKRTKGNSLLSFSICNTYFHRLATQTHIGLYGR